MKSWARFGLAFALTAWLSGPAWADRPYWHQPRSSVNLGIYVGDPWPYPPFYPYSPFPPRIYVPGPVIVTPPPVYIEQAPVVPAAPAVPPAAAPEPGYWYYCSDAKAYYPYVKECPGGWQRVAPQPAK